MSQNDLTIANQGFASFRSDLNSALQALGSTNSGTSAPSTTFANQLFYDTTNNILKIRNEDNDAFISLFTLDQTNDNIESLTIDGTLTYTGDLVSTTAGTSNFRAGVNAGDAIVSGGQYNVLVGDEAGTAITTGDRNSAFGFEALKTATTASFNVAVGYQALENNTGNSNTAIGDQALEANTSGANNSALGDDALVSNTSGSSNVAIGESALGANTTASNNTAVGKGALIANTTGAQNVAIGMACMSANTTGADSIAMGVSALDANTTGGNHVALGRQALQANTTGANNTAVGLNALNANTTANNNTAVGYQAGLSVTTGIFNTIMGGASGDALTDADYNVAIGGNSLSTDTKGNKSTAVGYGALNAQNQTSSTDTFNVAVGYTAGNSISTGVKNTLVGGLSGTHGGDLTTGSRNICIGYDNGVQPTGSHQIVIGDGFVTAGDNDFSFGKASNVVTNDFDSDANWSRSSDERLKKNITDQKLGLDFINDLRTVKYNWKPSHELDSTDSQLAHLYKEKEADNEMNTTVTMHNFIAQEVKTALDKAGVSDFAGWKEDQYGVQQVSREMFIIPLVKAMQELSAKNDALEARIKTLEG